MVLVATTRQSTISVFLAAFAGYGPSRLTQAEGMIDLSLNAGFYLTASNIRGASTNMEWI